MNTFETQIMNAEQLRMFKNWYDKHIGTEMEVSNVGDFGFCAVCFELEWTEVQAVANEVDRILGD